jgi:hypothetical protein
MMDLTLSSELAHIPDLRRQVRSLRYFRSSFNRGTDLVASHLEIDVEVDQARITSAFLNWADKFNLQKPHAALNRQDFSAFACGLLLSELIQAQPLRVSLKPEQAESSALPAEALAVARYWPEGFLLTSYCASVLEALMQQDFGESVTFAPVATHTRTWWSFRENAQEDSSSAIGFFDLFLGNEPNWQQPEAALERPAIRREALKHNTQIRLQ